MSLTQAVNAFLDELRREAGQSVDGQKTWTIPQTPAVNRAIEAMHYAVRRTP